MKHYLRPLVFAVALFVAACAPRERTVVILSTNDMHGRIQNFPQLATAVAECRDTADIVLLVDAGDRWTGNAYVDMAPVAGWPVLDLMNRLGYDAVTFGNHEFDHGQAHLGTLLDSMRFDVVCANLLSYTCTFRQIPPCAVIERDGLKIGFVGVITNYENNGLPAGTPESFEGLAFPDPQQQARRYGDELRDKADILVLLSHMGDDRDMELIARGSPYDLVVGGHTHEECDTLVGTTLLTQTGKNLRNLGVTRIRMKGHKVAGIDFELLPLADYAPDSCMAARVAAYYADEELNRPVGHFAADADKVGIAQWMASVSAGIKGDEIGFYHIGGVRLDSIPEGGVSVAGLYDLEPFGTKVARLKMTPAQMRRLIISKFNDKMNAKESHRVDLYSTTPYDIVVDAAGEAVDVRFPRLREGRTYRVAIPNYVLATYPDLEYSEGGVVENPSVVEALLDDLRQKGVVTPDNRPRQRIVK